MTSEIEMNDPIKNLLEKLPYNYVEVTKWRLAQQGIKKWDSQISQTAHGKRHDVTVLDELEKVANEFEKLNETRTFKLKKMEYAS